MQICTQKYRYSHFFSLSYTERTERWRFSHSVVHAIWNLTVEKKDCSLFKPNHCVLFFYSGERTQNCTVDQPRKHWSTVLRTIVSLLLFRRQNWNVPPKIVRKLKATLRVKVTETAEVTSKNWNLPQRRFSFRSTHQVKHNLFGVAFLFPLTNVNAQCAVVRNQLFSDKCQAKKCRNTFSETGKHNSQHPEKTAHSTTNVANICPLPTKPFTLVFSSHIVLMHVCHLCSAVPFCGQLHLDHLDSSFCQIVQITNLNHSDLLSCHNTGGGGHMSQWTTQIFQEDWSHRKRLDNTPWTAAKTRSTNLPAVSHTDVHQYKTILYVLFNTIHFGSKLLRS